MKNLTLVVVLILIRSLETISAQSINFNLVSPVPQLQGTDGGDMEFADIDNDGDNDLLLTGASLSGINTTLYGNDGNGNFTVIATFTGIQASTVGFNDIDSDGDLDLLMMGFTSLVTIVTDLYLNDGAGNFSLATNTSFEPLMGGDFEFVDIDNDNDDDLVMMGYGNSPIPKTKLYLNNGTGVFTEVTSTGLTNLLAGAVKSFDYDNDNDFDLLIIGEDANGVRTTELYNNDGSGNFSIVPNTAFKDFSAGDIATGDIDNDGDIDVLLCGNIGVIDIETELYLNDGTGSFTLATNTIFSDVSLGEASLNDLDNDGDLDVFVIGTGEGGGNTIVGNVYENLGNNNFVYADSLIGAYFSSHAVADIDGDNDLDLILGGTTTSIPTRATWLYENVSIISNVQEIDASTTVELYPNPSTGFINIRSKDFADTSIQIYSQIGQLVYSTNMMNELEQIELDVPNGVYIVTIQSGKDSFSQKLVIQK